MRWRAVVKGTGFTRQGRGVRQELGAHLRYCDRRGAREGTRFNDARDDPGRSEFIDAAAEGPGRVAAFKFAVSFRERASAPPDVREWTRKYVHALEERWKCKLTWSAVEHQGPHPHVHLVIAGSYEDERGKKRALFLSREKLNEMKTIARREFYRARPELWVEDKIDEISRGVGGPWRSTRKLIHPRIPTLGTDGLPEGTKDVVQAIKKSAHPEWMIPAARVEQHLKRIGINLAWGSKAVGQALEL